MLLLAVPGLGQVMVNPPAKQQQLVRSNDDRGNGAFIPAPPDNEQLQIRIEGGGVCLEPPEGWKKVRHAGVHAAEDLGAALALRGRLAAGESVVTRDGSLSAQWEHTVLVTSDGCEILTDRGD